MLEIYLYIIKITIIIIVISIVLSYKLICIRISLFAALLFLLLFIDLDKIFYIFLSNLIQFNSIFAIKFKLCSFILFFFIYIFKSNYI